MAFCGCLLQLMSTDLMPAEEKKRPYVFSNQTHWLLCLPTNRRKLSREGPGASARVEHRWAVGHAPSLGTVGYVIEPQSDGGKRIGCRALKLWSYTLSIAPWLSWASRSKTSPVLGFWQRRAAPKMGSRRNCLSNGGIYSARLIWSSSTPRPSPSKARVARRLDGTARAKIIGRISSRWWWGWRWIGTVGPCAVNYGPAIRPMSPRSCRWSTDCDNGFGCAGFAGWRTGV